MATTCKLIAKNTLGSSAASVTFSSIPSTYTDLLLIVSARTDRASQIVDVVGVRFNGNTSNYSARIISGANTQATSSSVASGAYTWGWFAYATAPNATSSTFASNEIVIPNYAGGANKSVSSTFAVENNSGATNEAFLGGIAGLWADTAAITSIDCVVGFGTNFVSGSSFYLYGITKA